LLDIATQPHVQLIVVPMQVGAHPGLFMGAFVVLEFGNPGDAPVAFLDNFNSSQLTDTPADVAVYQRAADVLSGRGLAGSDALDIIDNILEQLG
jgi:hypothetical protein